MKKILGVVIVLGLVCALTLTAEEVKPVKVDVVDFGEGVKLEMVLVPAGKFKMGFTKKEIVELKENLGGEIRRILKKDLGKRELAGVEKIISFQGRQHEVIISKPYYIGKYEVTQGQWEAVMGNNPSSRIKGAKFPVTDVSWEDCQKFIRKVNAKTNGGYRLPTEAEWEYACRAGTSTGYSFGNIITKSDANSWDSEIYKPVTVGNYKPNGFGLYDMHGNVWEWCEDWYDDYPFTVTDPKGPATGTVRIKRGGSFDDPALFARSSLRSEGSPTERNIDYGFRLARTP